LRSSPFLIKPDLAMKKVLVINYDYPPRRTSAVYRLTGLTRYLVRAGWCPTVLTVREREGDFQDLTLLKKIPPEVEVERTSYIQLSGWEGAAATTARTMGGLKSRYNATRQPLLDRALRSLGALARDILYFPDFSAGWIPFGFMRGAKLHRQRRFDAIFSSSPPRSAPLIGLLLKLLFGVPWVLEFMDPWYPAARPWRRALDSWLQSLMVRRADRIVVMTEGHADELRRRFSLPAHKLSVIPNGYDEEDFDHLGLLPSDLFEPGLIHLTHIGTVYPNHSGAFFPALAELLRERPDLKKKLRIHVIGFPDEAIQRFASQDGIREVARLRPFMPQAVALRVICASDGLLVFWGDREFSRLAIGGKVYDYLRAGRPIIAVAHPGGLKQLIEETHAGWVVPPDDMGAIKEVISRFVDTAEGPTPMPHPTREAVEQFRWDRLAERLASVLNEVTHDES